MQQSSRARNAEVATAKKIRKRSNKKKKKVYLAWKLRELKEINRAPESTGIYQKINNARKEYQLQTYLFRGSARMTRLPT